MHPALNRARVFAEPSRDIAATVTLGDQQHAVQPVQEMRFALRLDRGVNHLPDPFRAAEGELAHGVNLAWAPAAQPASCGNAYVASDIAAVRASSLLGEICQGIDHGGL